jgi:hypothetical protein
LGFYLIKRVSGGGVPPPPLCDRICFAKLQKINTPNPSHIETEI